MLGITKWRSSNQPVMNTKANSYHNVLQCKTANHLAEELKVLKKFQVASVTDVSVKTLNSPVSCSGSQ